MRSIVLSATTYQRTLDDINRRVIPNDQRERLLRAFHSRYTVQGGGELQLPSAPSRLASPFFGNRLVRPGQVAVQMVFGKPIRAVGSGAVWNIGGVAETINLSTYPMPIDLIVHGRSASALPVTLPISVQVSLLPEHAINVVKELGPDFMQTVRITLEHEVLRVLGQYTEDQLLDPRFRDMVTGQIVRTIEEQFYFLKFVTARINVPQVDETYLSWRRQEIERQAHVGFAETAAQVRKIGGQAEADVAGMMNQATVLTP